MTSSSLNIEKIIYKKIYRKVPSLTIKKINDLGDKILKKLRRNK